MCFMHELEAAMNPALLHNGESVKLLSNVLKTNVSACTLIGREFYFSVAGHCARRLSQNIALSRDAEVLNLMSDKISEGTPHYGVVLQPSGDVDVAATDALRTRMSTSQASKSASTCHVSPRLLIILFYFCCTSRILSLDSRIHLCLSR